MTDIEPPLPEPTPQSQPHWDGLAQHRLLLQRCTGCGLVRHYPRPMCDACHSMECDWVEAAGSARVHSWTVAHHAFHPAFKPELPYVLVTADLPEGVRLLARLEGDEAAALRIGQPLRIGFRDVAPGVTLPVFVPVEEG